jgi:hypothetical protein
MKIVEFTKPKGNCFVGYRGQYSNDEADSLIKRGFAIEVVEEQTPTVVAEAEVTQIRKEKKNV